MAKASRLESFEGGDFYEYAERLQFFFVADDIGQLAANANAAAITAADKKKLAVLVSQLSSTVYSTLKSLCLPDKPSDKKYAEVEKLLREYYKPAVSAVAATHAFHRCVQQEGETVLGYTTRLKRSAVDCKFLDHLDRVLRDQFIKGVRPLAVTKERLFKAV
eukprot:scpid108672/ scgid25637/ 